MPTDVEDTPLFDEAAGGQAERLLALISTRPPTSRELLAATPSKLVAQRVVDQPVDAFEGDTVGTSR
jgi:hypothetical protein